MFQHLTPYMGVNVRVIACKINLAHSPFSIIFKQMLVHLLYVQEIYKEKRNVKHQINRFFFSF